LFWQICGTCPYVTPTQATLLLTKSFSFLLYHIILDFSDFSRIISDSFVVFDNWIENFVSCSMRIMIDSIKIISLFQRRKWLNASRHTILQPIRHTLGHILSEKDLRWNSGKGVVRKLRHALGEEGGWRICDGPNTKVFVVWKICDKREGGRKSRNFVWRNLQHTDRTRIVASSSSGKMRFKTV